MFMPFIVYFLRFCEIKSVLIIIFLADNVAYSIDDTISTVFPKRLTEIVLREHRLLGYFLKIFLSLCKKTSELLRC
jgi:hypothetical protein